MDPTPSESQYILRLPPALAERVRAQLKDEKSRRTPFSLQMYDERKGVLHADDGIDYPAFVVDFPHNLESQKTYDGRVFYKCADIGQMVVVCEPGTEHPAIATPDFQARHGLTPPTCNIRRRKFRTKQQNLTEAEHEMLRLSAKDEAFEILEGEACDRLDEEERRKEEARAAADARTDEVRTALTFSRAQFGQYLAAHKPAARHAAPTDPSLLPTRRSTRLQERAESEAAAAAASSVAPTSPDQYASAAGPPLISGMRVSGIELAELGPSAAGSAGSDGALSANSNGAGGAEEARLPRLGIRIKFERPSAPAAATTAPTPAPAMTTPSASAPVESAAEAAAAMLSLSQPALAAPQSAPLLPVASARPLTAPPASSPFSFAAAAGAGAAGAFTTRPPAAAAATVTGAPTSNITAASAPTLPTVRIMGIGSQPTLVTPPTATAAAASSAPPPSSQPVLAPLSTSTPASFQGIARPPPPPAAAAAAPAPTTPSFVIPSSAAAQQPPQLPIQAAELSAPSSVTIAPIAKQPTLPALATTTTTTTTATTGSFTPSATQSERIAALQAREAAVRSATGTLKAQMVDLQAKISSNLPPMVRQRYQNQLAELEKKVQEQQREQDDIAAELAAARAGM